MIPYSFILMLQDNYKWRKKRFHLYKKQFYFCSDRYKNMPYHGLHTLILSLNESVRFIILFRVLFLFLFFLKNNINLLLRFKYFLFFSKQGVNLVVMQSSSHFATEVLRSLRKACQLVTKRFVLHCFDQFTPFNNQNTFAPSFNRQLNQLGCDLQLSNQMRLS